MTIKHDGVTVTDVAISLTDRVEAASAPPNSLVDKSIPTRHITITNNGTTNVFLGGPDVSEGSYGLAVAGGGTVSMELRASDNLFAVVAATTSAQLRILHAWV